MRLPRLVLLSAVVAAPLAAQQQPSSIPSSLAAALVNSEGGSIGSGVPLFSVGHAPERFPASLVPGKPASVLGGMWLGASGSIIVEYPAQSEAMPLVERALADSGWTSPAPTPTPSNAGFATPSMGYFRSGVLCKGTESVSLRPAFSSSGGTAVRITYTGPSTMPGPCDPRRSTIEDPSANRLTLPTLQPPPGAVGRPSGTSWGGDYTETRARVTGPQSAAELLAHYGAQLERAGWKGEPVVVSGDISVRPLSVTDPKGQVWRGTMMVLPLTSVEREIYIRMMRAPR